MAIKLLSAHNYVIAQLILNPPPPLRVSPDNLQINKKKDADFNDRVT